jgi:hypothetical protein
MKLLKSFDTFNTKVFVYWNLHKDCFSVKALEGEHKGLVVAHTDSLKLRDALPKVSQAGRQRVIAEGKKNVHAGITGYIRDTEASDMKGNLYYNPYKVETFVHTHTQQEWTGSKYVNLSSRYNICAY